MQLVHPSCKSQVGPEKAGAYEEIYLHGSFFFFVAQKTPFSIDKFKGSFPKIVQPWI